LFDFVKRRVFGRRSPPPAALAVPVRREDGPAFPILVRESAYNQSGPSDLVFEVVEFFRFATGPAQYERDELSPNALRSHYVTQYEGAVNNGGHGAYASWSGGERVYLTSVQEGLVAIGHPLADTHRKLLDFALANTERMTQIVNNRGFGEADPFEKYLDKEFFRIIHTTPIMARHNAWLKTLPELKVIPDAQFKAAKDALIAANPSVAERARQHAAEQAAKDAKDPLKQALIYLCSKSSDRRLYRRWVTGIPGMDLGDGIKVTRFLFDSDKGATSAFFHPKYAALFDDSRRDKALVTLPTHEVLRVVKQKTGQDLDKVMHLWSTGNGPATPGRSS
jgi:hypothetical protein